MNEKRIEEQIIDTTDTDNIINVQSNILEEHEQKMGKMLDDSHNIVKQIKQMSQEISNDLKLQNKLINEIGETVNKTDFELKKNTSKIEQILLKTSTCSLIFSAIIQIIVIVFLILF